MNRFLRLHLVMVIIAAIACLAIPDMADAGRGGSSFSRSSGSSFSRSSSSSSPSRSSSLSRSSSSNSSKKSFANQQRSTAKPKQDARSALQQKAKSSGTSFKSKSAATSDFKSKYGSKYTSTYKTQPATRPEHIPQTYSSGGKTYNVTYNTQYGGYGYMYDGRWMMYDAMADAAMLSVLMSRNNYYYDGMPVRSGPVVYRDGGSAGVIFGVVVLFILIFVVLGIFFFRP